MKRFFVPEAVQTSAMDCGPAALKALLEGFGIHVSYGRLREACQTDVDGTSIDQLEEAAIALGLDACQVMLPLDHLFATEVENLPAIVVVTHPNGLQHFVVFWRRHGGWVQVMDPAVGRRWISVKQQLKYVYEHTQAVSADEWRAWAATDSFLKPLGSRIRRVGANPGKMIASALQDPSPRSLARLDAAVRMTSALIDVDALGRGQEATRFLLTLVGGTKEIPDQYWSARFDPAAPETLRISGAVLVQARGRSAAPSSNVSPELVAALTEKPARPGLDLLRALRADGLLVPGLVVVALALAAAGTVVEAILLRGFLDLAQPLATSGQRIAAAAALLAFGLGMLALEFTTTGGILRTSRRLEARLRLRFLEKVPRLADRYFRSRLISDMAERCHNVHQLRQGPELAAIFLRSIFGIAFTVAAIGWLYPESLLPAIGVAVLGIAVPLLTQPVLAERDLRLRTHAGALMRYYLDALQGLMAIRAHSADRVLRREQSALLVEWARAGFVLQRTVVTAEGFQFALSLAASAWLVWSRLTHGGEVGGMLLLVYWVLNLPAMGEDAAAVAWQYPMQRNTTLRLLEPLGAPEEEVAEGLPQRALESAVEIAMDQVTVHAAGHTILDQVSLRISPGSHVAIVGLSGAGKSTLVGLLLGWHRPSSGELTVDGQPLNAATLDRLRRHTAWIDPQVQLWNRSLFDNLRYGAGSASITMDQIIENAGLTGVLEKLPDGLQTVLGEGGTLVSGGEGQRVRTGRAMARGQVRLAILDEPARGLDHTQRRAIVTRAREHWKHSTLLCITHDVGDTLDFKRVLVIEAGRVVEDGAPQQLAARPDSIYRRLLDAEDEVRRCIWSSAQWRRMRIEDGKLRETEEQGAYVESSH